MKFIPFTVVLAAFATPVCAPAQSASDLSAALQDCAAITSGTERLSCFDRLAGTSAASAAAPAADSTRRTDGQDGPAAETTAGTAAPRTREPGPETAASAPAASSPASIPSSPATPSASADAGEGTGSSAASGAEEDGDGEFAAVVTRVASQPRGEHVVYLENGQVWQENFASRYFPVEAGDTVTIKERFFGGHRLVTASGKGIRVKRIQ